jgi:hypothetical protein
MPPAEEYDVHFLNEFFDPERAGYNKEQYLAALSDDGRSLADRIDQIGLLEGQPGEVTEALGPWFANWPQAAQQQVVDLLREGVTNGTRVQFVFRRTDTPGVDVARADFPTKPLTILVSAMHP